MAYFSAAFFASQFFEADYFNAGGGAPPTPAPVVIPDRGAGSGKKRRNIPKFRLLNGQIYQAETWEEFTRLLAAVEYRLGEPPYQPVKKTQPIKIKLTPEQLAESYRAYLAEVSPEPQLTEQRLTELEFRLGLIETEIEEEESRRDRARRLLLLLS